MRKAAGSYRTYSSLVKLQPWFLSLLWKTCIRQNCSLGSCACSEGPALAQNTLMMMMILHVTWCAQEASESKIDYYSKAICPHNAKP